MSNDEQIDYEVPAIEMPTAIQEKLDDAGKKYPVWNAKEKGETVYGLIESVEFLPHLNDGQGNYIIRMVGKDQDKFVVFPNKVMHRVLSNLTKTKKIEDLTDMVVYIQYLGEQQPKDTKLKPYKTYAAIEA